MHDRKLKIEMVIAYGGACSCCGEKQLEFLTVEHIDGNGKKHRDEVGHGRYIYKDLKKRGWPKENFTIMCWNCNCARKYNRPCPHNITEYMKWLISMRIYDEERNL